MARVEVFAPDEVAVVHVINRVVRRCFLLGDDPVTGKNYDHRKGIRTAVSPLFYLDLKIVFFNLGFSAILESDPYGDKTACSVLGFHRRECDVSASLETETARITDFAALGEINVALTL